eukprot:m.23486 g.23486  ORF g.23486 m.23486 type:complete len:198 (+) comp7505_c0_seq2:215-808(+)
MGAAENTNEMNTKWETCEGLVNLCISQWKIEPQWKYCLKRKEQSGPFYFVEAIYSIPTRRNPIPNATASVLFKIDPGEQQDGNTAASQTVEVTIDASEDSKNKGKSLEDIMNQQASRLVDRVLTETTKRASRNLDEDEPPNDADKDLTNHFVGVDFSYTMEGQKLVHYLETEFKQAWLKSILDAKRIAFGVSDLVLQ